MKDRSTSEANQWKLISLGAETQFAPDGIVSRTLFRSGQQRVTLFGFSAGQELTEHTTTAHALVQILSGQSEWMLDGERRILRAGDLLYMPPHLRHAGRATGDFSMLLTLLPSTAPAVALASVSVRPPATNPAAVKPMAASCKT